MTSVRNGPRRKTVPPRLLAVLCLAWLTAACSAPRHGLDACLTAGCESHREAVTLSARYRVRTDAGIAAARQTADFMEQAADLWGPLFGDPDPAVLPLEVHLHQNTADLSALLARRNLSPLATGLYLPGPTPTIHTTCCGKEPGHPYRTLLHEGTHQFVHLVAGCPVPRGHGDNTGVRLAIPLWLNEGLAAYYEGAFVTPDRLEAGRVAPLRLKQLQQALRRGRAPSVGSLMAKHYGASFAPVDYATAWGIVYALMQEAPLSVEKITGRQWIQGVVEKSRQGWGALDSISSNRPARRWWNLITERTRADFEAYLAGSGIGLPEWEARWRKWILSLP